MNQHTDTEDASGITEMYAALKQRDETTDSSVQVTRDELLTLEVATKPQFGTRDFRFDHDAVVTSGTKDIDPISYYLMRVNNDQCMALKCVSRVSDGGPEYYLTGIGDVQVTSRPLADDFGTDLDLTDSQVDALREEFTTVAEESFYYMENTHKSAWNGSTAYMSFEDTWTGWERMATENLGIGSETWRHEVRPAISEARPSGPHILETPMVTEYAVTVTFE